MGTHCGSRIIVLSVLAALLAAAAPLAAEPRAESAAPAQALAAAAERWKLQRAPERAGQPGAAGQHDLFWEVLRLWEKDPKARADADLTAVMDWLLFSAGLWMDPNLADPIYGKVPVLVPALGEALLDRRLAGWVGTLQAGSSGTEPWLWPDFAGIDRKAFAAAVRRAKQTGPKNNPVAVAWLATALVAVDDPKGPEELTAAQAGLAKDLPSRAAQINLAILESLSRTGSRACLGMFLDQAEAELAKPGAERDRPVYGGSMPYPLTRFFQMVGWTFRGFLSGRPDYKAELAKARTWLKENQDKLAWDPKLRRFTGGAPQPGMEKLMGAAEKVQKDWGLNIAERLISGAFDSRGMAQELLTLMESKPQAAKDPALGDLVLALLSEDRSLSSYERMAYYTRITKLNPALAAGFWTADLREALLKDDAYGLESLIRSMSGSESAPLDAISKQLVGEFEKLYAEAAKSGDQEKALKAALALLYVGGKLDKKELAELVAKAPATWTSGGSDNRLTRWARSIMSAGRPAGLRVLLAVGRREMASYRPQGGAHPIRSFWYSAGWREYADGAGGPAEEELTKAETWLDRYEGTIKWDKNKGRFAGAPPPGAEALTDCAEAVQKRYGLKTDDVLAGGADEARRLFSELIELMEKKPEAAKDQQVADLVLALVEPARVNTAYDDVLRDRLYVKLPRVNRPAGVRVWSAYLRKLLLPAVPVGAGELSGLRARFKGLDAGVVAEAAKALGPELKKALEAAQDGKFDERVGRTMAYIYAGGEAGQADLDKLLAEADKLGSSGLSRLTGWGQPLAEVGIPFGLKLMLVGAKGNRYNRVTIIHQFEYLVGKLGRPYPEMIIPELIDNRNEEAQLARIEADLKWLEDNQKNLEFDPTQSRFRLKGGARGEAPDPGRKPEVF